MSLKGLIESLVVSSFDGPANAGINTNFYTSILDPSWQYVFPPEYFDKVGKSLRINARGVFNSNGTPGTVTFVVQMNSSNVFTSGAITPRNNQVNGTFELELILTCRQVGTPSAANSTNFIGVGSLNCTNTSGAISQTLPATLPAVGGNCDNTSNTTFDLGVSFATLSASNWFTVNQFVLEAMN